MPAKSKARKGSDEYLLKTRKVLGGSTNRNVGGTVSQGLNFSGWLLLGSYRTEVEADEAMVEEAERIAKRKTLEQLAIFYRGKKLRTFPDIRR